MSGPSLAITSSAVLGALGHATPKSVAELSVELGRSKSSILHHLALLESSGHVQYTSKTSARKTGAEARIPAYMLGENSGPLPDASEMSRELRAKKNPWKLDCGIQHRISTPARQIGMWREPLVAALFGPARAGAEARA